MLNLPRNAQRVDDVQPRSALDLADEAIDLENTDTCIICGDGGTTILDDAVMCWLCEIAPPADDNA